MRKLLMKVLKMQMYLNSYFESVTESLDLFNWAPEPYNQTKDSVERIIKRFSHQCSIIKINQNIKTSKKLSFTPVKVGTMKNK